MERRKTIPASLSSAVRGPDPAASPTPSPDSSKSPPPPPAQAPIPILPWPPAPPTPIACAPKTPPATPPIPSRNASTAPPPAAAPSPSPKSGSGPNFLRGVLRIQGVRSASLGACAKTSMTNNHANFVDLFFSTGLHTLLPQPPFFHVNTEGPVRLAIVRVRTRDIQVCRRSPVFSYSSRLFVAQEKLKCFVFSKIQTLFAKHRGWGYPSPAFQFETRQAPVHTHAPAPIAWYQG